MEYSNTIIIGAGAAGLAVAKELKQRKIEVILLESGRQVGQRWADRYEGLKLNTVGWLSELPGLSLGNKVQRFPNRKQWIQYLQRYWKHYKLDTRFQIKVLGVDRVKGKWVISTTNGEFSCHFLVMATGHDNDPVVPLWDGLEGYTGQFLHSSAYKNPQPFRSKSVLVVGSGNSGCEIAGKIAETACSKVWISVRRPPLILPETFLGISLTTWGLIVSLFPDCVLDQLGRIIQRVSFGDLSYYGLPPSPKRLSGMRHHYYSPPIDRGFVAAVKTGEIEVVAAVQKFEGSYVFLKDNSVIQPEFVIAATGYQPGLKGLLGHLNVLDKKGRPRLLKNRSSVVASSLYFAGFKYGLLALLPYIKEDARKIAKSILRS